MSSISPLSQSEPDSHEAGKAFMRTFLKLFKKQGKLTRRGTKLQYVL